MITKGARLLPSAPDGASWWLHRKLIGNGLELHYDTPIAGRERTSLVAADGTRIEADYVVQATGLQAHSLVHNCELATRAEDGLLVNSRLQSVADSRIFAGGDCAAMEDYALPKLGVFGVRQAAVIHANLLAMLQKCPLTEYKPQKNYLAILNLGDKTALATRGRFWWNGRFSMKLKDLYVSAAATAAGLKEWCALIIRISERLRFICRSVKKTL